MFILPFAFKGKIIEIVKKEISKTLTVDLDFKKAGLNLFSEFPYLAVNIQEVSAIGREAFVGDTLAYVDKLHLAVNLKSIFGDDGIEIRKVNIHHPIVNLLIDEAGLSNWDVMRSNGEEVVSKEENEEESSLKLLLKDVIISQAFIVYDDREAEMKAVLEDLNLRLAGDFTSDFTTLNIAVDVDKLSFIMDGIPYLSCAKTIVKGDIDADLKNEKYTLKEILLTLNALDFNIDGWVALMGDDMDMDLSLKAVKSDFKNFLSLIPAIYAKDFENIQTKGTLGFTADVKGKMTETAYPAFDINLAIENAMFKYPDLPKSVDNIQIAARANSPGGDLNNTTINVSKLHLEMADNPFDLRLKLAKPMSNPTFDFMAKGVINLNIIDEFYPLDDNMEIRGVLTADLQAQGDMKSIDDENYESVDIKGIFSLVDGKFVTDMFDKEIVIDKFNLDFSQKYVHLLAGLKIGGNDLNADGRLENFIAYALRDDVVRGNLKLKSNYLNMNDFMDDSEESPAPEKEENAGGKTEESTLSVIEIPANIDFGLDLDIKQLIFNNIDMLQVSGKATVKDQILDMKNLSMKTMGGDMKVAGKYIVQNPQRPEINLGLEIKSVDVKKTAQTFVTFQKLFPIIENTTGTISLDFNIQADLNQAMSPNLNTLNANGKISSPGIKIENLEVLNKLSDALKMEKLRTVAVDRFNLSFKCENGRIITSPFDLKTGNIKATVSGATGLDETIDYLIDAKIPRSEFGAGANDVINNLTGNVFGTGINVKIPDVLEIPVKIGGTFKNPTVNLSGIGNIGKDIIDDLIDQGKDKINEQIDKAIEEAKKQRDKLIAEAKKQRDKLIQEAEKQRDKLIAEAQKQCDNLVAQARNGGDKLIAEAEKQGNELIKKAGSNIIAKKAAEEGAKKLKQEAQNSANKLVGEATTQGDKIMSEAKKQGDNAVNEVKKQSDKIIDEAKKQGDKLIQEAEKTKL
jgi:vacuolar-type H+-ATPase subunit H